MLSGQRLGHVAAAARREAAHMSIILYRTVALALVLAACTPSAHAGMLYINTPVAKESVQSVFATAKYRLSHTNWDQSLAASSGTAKQSDFVFANLGNTDTLAKAVYDFSLRALPSEGLVFSLTNRTTGETSTLSWGTFSSDPGGTNAAKLAGREPVGSYNSISLVADAMRDGSSMSFRELTISGPALKIVQGAFDAGTVDPKSAGPDDPLGTYTQRVFADEDLSRYEWELTGTIFGSRSPDAGGDEQVRLTIVLADTQVEFADGRAIPSPDSSAAIAGFGLLVAARRRPRPDRHAA
jgi:methionine-rich copper-binding protein CopC